MKSRWFEEPQGAGVADFLGQQPFFKPDELLARGVTATRRPQAAKPYPTCFIVLYSPFNGRSGMQQCTPFGLPFPLKKFNMD